MPKKHLHPLLKKYSSEDYIYGIHAVDAALNNKKRKIKILVVSQSKQGKYQHIAENTNIKVISLSNTEIKSILPEGSVHQGVALIASQLPVLNEVPKLKVDRNLIIVLDGVTDPHNVGAILRVCVAFGCSHLIMQDRNAPRITGTLAKISAGALEKVNIIRAVNLSKIIKNLQSQNYIVYGADGNSDTYVGNISFAPKSVIVMGGEGSGIRNGIKNICDQIISINMSPEIESLNVSVATGIMMNHYYNHSDFK